MSTAIDGSRSGGTPMVSNSSNMRAAPLKSRTAIAERSASRKAMRCNSSGSEPMAASMFLNCSRASLHLPRRASATARQIGALNWLPTERVRQILERILRPLQHHVGDALEHGAGDVVAVQIGQRDVDHALGFRPHVARQIEAGEIEPRLIALGLGRVAA